MKAAGTQGGDERDSNLQRQGLRWPLGTVCPAACCPGDKKGRPTQQGPGLGRGHDVHGHSTLKEQWQNRQGLSSGRRLCCGEAELEEEPLACPGRPGCCNTGGGETAQAQWRRGSRRGPEKAPMSADSCRGSRTPVESQAVEGGSGLGLRGEGAPAWGDDQRGRE